MLYNAFKGRGLRFFKSRLFSKSIPLLKMLHKGRGPKVHFLCYVISERPLRLPHLSCCIVAGPAKLSSFDLNGLKTISTNRHHLKTIPKRTNFLNSIHKINRTSSYPFTFQSLPLIKCKYLISFQLNAKWINTIDVDDWSWMKISI